MKAAEKAEALKIQQMLDAGVTKTRVAKEIGCSRVVLYARLVRYGLADYVTPRNKQEMTNE